MTTETPTLARSRPLVILVAVTSIVGVALCFVFVLVLNAANRAPGASYLATFDQPGTWGVGRSDEVEGQVVDGVYSMRVMASHGMFTATAGESFADGVFEVEATQVEGPLNNGFGLVFRVSDNNYYALEISGDGYVWIGYCQQQCRSEAVALVGGDWFRSATIKTGLYETNLLRVVADGPSMSFFVNGVQVGRASDGRLTEGDIGVMVETLGEPGVHVVFDNFKVTPLQN